MFELWNQKLFSWKSMNLLLIRAISFLEMFPTFWHKTTLITKLVPLMTSNMNPKIGNDHHYKTCFFKRPDSCRFKRPTPRSSEIVVEEQRGAGNTYHCHTLKFLNFRMWLKLKIKQQFSHNFNFFSIFIFVTGNLV